MKLRLYWYVNEETAQNDRTAERYCHNCGRKTLFIDSGVRRHNANGKNIYQYAIYKCPKGHTWNKKLDQYKAKKDVQIEDKQLENKSGQENDSFPHSEGSENTQDGNYSEQDKIQLVRTMLQDHATSITLEECMDKGIDEIEIRIANVSGRCRIDKWLSQKIEDCSRSHISYLIQEGLILVNGQCVKPKTMIRELDCIRILLNTRI